VRRIFEPLCAPVEERWRVVETLQAAGIETSVAIAPILPCDPEAMIAAAVRYSNGPIVADALHVRAVKRPGATTRDAAIAICDRYGWNDWLEPAFQRDAVARMADAAKAAGRLFGFGPPGFGLLANVPAE
jgi:DNA repair photolyase